MAWLGTWADRMELAIYNANIDTSLYNFPVLINLSSSSGLTNLDLSHIFSSMESTVNRKKIAVTDYTGTNQYYVEIEKWDQEASSAQLWVNIPEVHLDRTTMLYLYYDKAQTDNTTYVGDVGSTPAQQVWNSNFVAVYNLNQDPSVGGACILESTVSGADSNISGNMPATALVTGAVGNALLFDGVDDKVWGYGDNTRPTDNFSFECICKTSDTHVIYSESNSTADCVTGEKYVFSPDNKSTNAGAGVSVGTNGITVVEHGNTYMPPLAVYEASIGTEFNHICIVYTDRTPAIYLNGTKVHTGLQSGKPLVFSPRTFGSHNYGFFEGVIDNVRFSKISLSDSWVKATHHSNADNLIIFREVATTSWLQTYEGGSLSPWGKRIKLEIDNTKVDNSLVNFPTLININSTSGYNNKDATDLLTDLDYVFVGDTFSGTNGDAPNTDLWYITKAAADGSIEINNNKLRCTVPLTSADEAMYLTSRFNISGDFDVQVDYDVIFTDPPSSSVSYTASLNILFYDGSDSIQASYCDTSATEYMVAAPAWTSDEPVFDPGKLRITRVGSVIKIYVWSGSQWEWAGNTDGYTTSTTSVNNVRVRIHTHADFNGGATVDFDNFTVTSGTVIWPQNTHPYRKKLAVTSEDGTTQLPVEIDYWDATTSGIQLWTQVPHVKSTETTDLYMYYDVTKSNNSDYVGDTGSTVAQSVWDDNFVAVYHFSQSPTTSTKDSTIYGANGTSYGTMTTDDFVETSIGRGSKLDGSDDYINCGYNAVHDITDKLTLEALITPATTWDNSDPSEGIISRQSDPTDSEDTYELAINTDGKLHLGTYGGNLQGTRTSWSASTEYYVAATYNSDGLVGDLFVDGIKEVLTVDTIEAMAGSTNNLVLGKGEDTGAFLDTTFDEVRISNTVRSDAWIETTSHSNYDTLIYYNTEEGYTAPVVDAYFYHGTVKDNAIPVERTILLYKRSSGELMDSTTSDSSGYYLLETPYNEEHFVVALDDEAGEDYDALIQDRLPPNGQ